MQCQGGACKTLTAVAIHITIPTRETGNTQYNLADLDDIVAAQKLDWGSDTWAQALQALHGAIMQAIQRLSTNTAYLSVLQGALAATFAPGSDLKLERFASLQELLRTNRLPSAVREALAKCQPTLRDMVNSLFASHCGGAFPANSFSQLSQRMRGFLAWQLHACLSTLDNVHGLPSGFALTEDASSAVARRALLNKRQKLQEVSNTVNQLFTCDADTICTDADTDSASSSCQLDSPAASVQGGTQPLLMSAFSFSFDWPAKDTNKRATPPPAQPMHPTAKKEMHTVPPVPKVGAETEAQAVAHSCSADNASKLELPGAKKTLKMQVLAKHKLGRHQQPQMSYY